MVRFGLGRMKLLEKYKNFILDCDGVLWHSAEAIEGSIQAIKTMKDAGKNVIFVTNNAVRSRKTYLEKFNELGFENVKVEDINTSGSAAAEYCKSCGFKKVFAIGEIGVVDELAMRGIEVVREESGDLMSDEEFAKIEIEPNVDAVVVGWDRSFNYRKLCYSSLYIQNGAKLVGTNPDASDRVGGKFMPGNGCSIAAIQYSVDDPSGKRTVITGKPNQTFMAALLAKYNFDKAETIMVGDRLDTDVLFGASFGVDTLMVLSGCSTLEQINEIDGKSNLLKPTYTSKNLSEGLQNASKV